MPLPLAAVGLGLGLIGGIGRVFGRKKANQELKRLEHLNPQYQENPFARARLGLAQTMFGGRMPGAAEAERNIFSNQASTVGNVMKNATDAGTALAYATGSQTATNDALTNLGMKEADNKQNMLSNLNSAYETMIGEGDKSFQDKIRRFNDSVSFSGARQQNRQAGWGDLSNFGFGLMNMGMGGGGNMSVGDLFKTK